MSLRLILTRHAKSDWDDAALEDHERPLNKRGRRDAPRIGAWLAAQGYIPDIALVSAATRTAETWELLSGAFEREVPVQFHQALYHAAPQGMLQVLQNAQAANVMMIGHNPGIAALASGLLREPPQHDRFYDYPTCTTLVAEFPLQHWSEVDRGSGRALAFATPHDL